MQLDDFLIRSAAGIQFSKAQASNFAKEVAGDFNPLHNADGKLFCVPGDLLFAVALNKYGLNRHMRFIFSGMVGEGTDLIFPDTDDEQLDIVDAKGKQYLTIERGGENTHQQQLIHDLTCSYVTFSGKAFPHILVPLMREHDTMINTSRPMVIYESMVIDLDHLDFIKPELEMSETTFKINGKKGDIRLGFDVKANGETVGRGAKYMLVRGLRPFDEEQMNGLINEYTNLRDTYSS